MQKSYNSNKTKGNNKNCEGKIVMKTNVIEKYVKDLDGLLKEVKESEKKLGDVYADRMYHVESAVIFVFGTIFKFFNFSSIMFGAQTGIDAAVDCNNEILDLEFATYSSNVKKRHIKDIRKDKRFLIVCWEHNWKECPSNIDVLELKQFWEKGQEL